MDTHFDRVALIVLDGVGCGEADDTQKDYPQDGGANSLVHASKVKPFDAGALRAIGLQYIPGLHDLATTSNTPWTEVRGAVGALEPTFAGNGSPEGHQALTGHLVKTPYRLFNVTGFPPGLVSRIERVVEIVLNRAVKVIRYPDTDDINGEKFFTHPSIGDVHYSSRDPSKLFFLPIYASSDSLVQVALHIDVIPLEMMEAVCRAIRTQALAGEFQNVARVILRVWGGAPGNFKRLSEHRRDFGVDPDGETVIDFLAEKGIPVLAVGKAGEMLNDRGFDPRATFKGETDQQRIAEVAGKIRAGFYRGLIFANLKDTDEKSGHTRKPKLYVDHIEAASSGIGAVIAEMRERDLLIITADHGTDPTQSTHTNHTRERVPLLVASPKIVRPIELGIRRTYADVSATIAEIFSLEGHVREGTSFLRELVG